MKSSRMPSDFNGALSSTRLSLVHRMPELPLIRSTASLFIHLMIWSLLHLSFFA